MDTASNSHVEIFQTSKGKPLIFYEGYKLYNNRTNKDGSMYFVCRTKGCKVSMRVKENNILRKSDHIHNHEADGDDCVTLRVMCGMRKRAREETTPIPTIYDQEI